ncbi:MAG: hypothetical protein SFV17_14790 [Candidatus Obscuribacter sp.]|nr:hypothetical protein [Candidatus Obscuribacter sp.]
MRQMVDGDLTEHGAGGEQSGTGRTPGSKPESDRNAGDRSSKGRSQNDRQKRRAMTRMIDRVSDDFVSTFSETGVDHGPDGEQKKQTPSAAALSRDERERAEAEAQNQAKAELRGFGSLLGAKRATSQNLKVGGMFSRLLGGDDEDAAGSIGGASEMGTGHGGATSFEAPDGPTADGSVIKVKGTVGKKRGLYTSCMKKPVVPEDVIAAANAGTDHGVAGKVGGGGGGAGNAGGIAGGGAGTASGGVSGSEASHQSSASAPAVGSQHGPSHVVPQVPVRGNFSHSEHVHEKSFPLYDAATTSKGMSFNNRAARSEVEESSDGPDESFPAPNITNVPLPHVRSAAASAREFEMPTVPEQAKQEGKDFSTLRKLANDGKGSKVIPSRPAPAGARNGRFAADTEAHESPESSQGSSVSPKTGIVGKFFGALKKLFSGK